MAQIYYRTGYKYQLVSTYVHQLSFTIPNNITTPFIDVSPDGLMVIREGYAWDGPSGPALDTKNFMRGSLVHDAIYQLERDGFLDIKFKDSADRELVGICKEDGMGWLRRKYVYWALKHFALSAITHKRPIRTAP